MFNKFVERAKYVTTGEDGASMIEIMVWFAVVLVVGLALMAIKTTVVSFLNKANEKIGTFEGTIDGFNQTGTPN